MNREQFIKMVSDNIPEPWTLDTVKAPTRQYHTAITINGKRRQGESMIRIVEEMGDIENVEQHLDTIAALSAVRSMESLPLGSMEAWLFMEGIKAFNRSLRINIQRLQSN